MVPPFAPDGPERFGLRRRCISPESCKLQDFLQERRPARIRPGVMETPARPGSRPNARPAAAGGGRSPRGPATGRSGRPRWARGPSHDGRQPQRGSASSNAAAMSFTGPQATPGLRQRLDPVGGCRGSPARFSSSFASSARLVTRAGLVAKRGSDASSVAPEHAAQRRELPVVAGRHGQRPVGRPQRLVGGDARVRVAHPPGHHAAGHVGGGLVHHRRQHAGQQVHVHALALARAPRARSARPGSRSSRTGRPPRPPAPRPTFRGSSSPVMLISPPTACRMKS